MLFFFGKLVCGLNFCARLQEKECVCEVTVSGVTCSSTVQTKSLEVKSPHGLTVCCFLFLWTTGQKVDGLTLKGTHYTDFKGREGFKFVFLFLSHISFLWGDKQV